MGTTSEVLSHLREDDSDNDDTEESDNDAQGNTPRVVSIPGAISVSQPTPTAIDYDAPPTNVVYFLRQYLNQLFGSLLYEIMYGDEHLTTVNPSVGVFDEDGPLRAIPNVVGEILEYNNVYFERIDMIQSQDPYVPEPIWYTVNLRDNSLRLHLNRTLYKRYCSRAPIDRPVTIIPCRIPLDELDPSRPTEDLPQIDRAVVFCAVLCDHVAQHVLSHIHELLENRDSGSSKEISCEDDLMLHAHYADAGRGSTLHSMFHVTAIAGQPIKPRNNIVNVTLLNSTMPHGNSVELGDNIIDRLFNR